MSSFKNYLRKKRYATKTIESNNVMLLDFLTWLDQENMEAENVKHRDLLGYIKYKQKREVQQITIQRYLNAVKLFYAFKISTGTMKNNPVTNLKIQGIKRRKLYHTFTSEELHKIYNSYEPTDLIGKRNKVILGIYVYQGIQSAELYKLEVNHLNLRKGEIEIPGTKRSNTRTLQLESHQVLDIYDFVLQTRKEILQISQQETNQLFVSPKGGNDQSNFVAALMRDLKRKNKQIQNAQQLRTSVIVKWLKQYNLIEVQHKAGHRFVSSTESFLVNEVEGLQEEVNQYHPLS